MYTRIAASDLIHSEQRSEILDRIRQSITLLETTPMPEERVEIQQVDRLMDKKSLSLTLFLGVITSLAGTFVAAYATFTSPSFNSITQFFNTEVIGVFIASFAIILSLIYLFKVRDRNEQPSRQTALQRTIDFESEVSKILSRYGAKASMAATDSGYDFEIDKNGKRILLEVKAWSQRVPIAIQKQILARLQEAIRLVNADEAWLIVKDKSVLPKDILNYERINVISLDELRNRLSQT